MPSTLPLPYISIGDLKKSKIISFFLPYQKVIKYFQFFLLLYQLFHHLINVLRVSLEKFIDTEYSLISLNSLNSAIVNLASLGPLLPII